MLRSLQLKRLLSFGPDAGPVELGPLNVLIGPNGSGKSNFLEAIGLLHAAPGDLVRPVREGGGVGAWLWQGEAGATAEIEAVLEHPTSPGGGLRHRIAFAEVGQR
ncbi:MAG TPA: AAA family ATPase, partial [Nannocystis sp.]